MWLQRLLNKTAQGGGAGGDIGGSSANVMGVHSLPEAEGVGVPPNREQQQINRLRRKKNRKSLERHKKWRLSKDPKQLQ